ncbi:MAG: lysophospholipid acyltransferase family protein [Syntrophaceae bacterium]|nr:lysophospholipid acyltransferase family protein [Syntrophaceae bacterium]
MKTGNRWKKLKFALLLKLTKPLYYFLCLYNKTLRIQIKNEQNVLAHMRNRGPVLLASWHQRFFSGFFLPRMFNLTVPIMISQSRDGDFIANVVKFSGFFPVRGSTSRGGKEALREMIDAIKEYGIGAHILDGPTGPPREVKAGLIAMAQRTGAVICPVYVVCEKYWVFNSWDRFMVPKPFSQVLIYLSEELESVPAYLDGADFEAARKKIEDRIIQKYEEMDRYFTKPH